ncbi:MAG: hypothetical protein WA040_20400 [Anaerolineae bacterium]
MTKLAMLFFICTCLAATLVGCSSNDSPDKAAKGWLQALADQDGLAWDQLTCAAQKSQNDKEGVIFTALGAIVNAILGDGVAMDVSDVKAKTTKRSDYVAIVHVRGDVRTALGLMVESEALDEDWVMVKEDGQWKYCGTTTLGSDDPRWLVLQQDEVPFTSPETYYAFDDTEQFFKESIMDEDVEVFLRDNLKAVSGRAYEGDEEYTVSCIVSVFPDSATANWLFNEEMAESSEDEIVKGLGDEALRRTTVFDSESGLETGYYFYWRAGNVVFHLVVQDRSGQLTEADVRKLADKMQSHLD